MNETLDIRHISIIDALPVFQAKKEILTVGCGNGMLEHELQKIGFDVIATDYFEKESRENTKFLDQINYQKSSIFDLSSFSVDGRETVICSEVLEHLPNYKEAFKNLLQLTHRRLIVTIPWNISYDVEGPPPEGHCNYWTDRGENPFTNIIHLAERDPNFKDIREFITMAWPYHVTISKIATKSIDWNTSSRCYMIVVDKTQMSDFVWKKSMVCHQWQLMVNKEGRYEHNLSPVKNKFNGHPPTRIGPYLSHDIQPMCTLIITEEYDDKEWLGNLEYELHEKKSAKLLIVKLASGDITEENIRGFFRSLNESRHLVTTVFLMKDKFFEELGIDHDAVRLLKSRKVFVGDNHKDYDSLCDATIERDELNSELIEKIVDAV